MLEELTLLTGTAEEKAIQCLEKAGWYPGRKTDITEVESYYSGKGITLTEPQKDIFREFYGIAEGWYLYDQEDMVMPETDLSGTHPDFEFYLLPGKYPRIYSRSVPESIYSTDIPEGSYYNDQIKKIEQRSGSKVVHIGRIGYHYPAECLAEPDGRLWCISNASWRISDYDSMTDFVTDWGNFDYGEWNGVIMHRYIIDENSRKPFPAALSAYSNARLFRP